MRVFDEKETAILIAMYEVPNGTHDSVSGRPSSGVRGALTPLS
jgi:hypothetical protein